MRGVLIHAVWVLAVVAMAIPLTHPPAATLTGTAPALAPEGSSLPAKLDADPTPVLGWSSWSFLREGVNASTVEAEAHALVSSGLASYGYRYVNLDDGWYVCPGPQGPSVDAYGRWTINATKFPADGSESGIAAVADYVHRLGLKFGIYETTGISEQAVREDSPVLGTNYTADEIATRVPANNYNCGGMVGLNYSSPGAQAFVDSIVAELASWGVDYVKLDGITNANVPDLRAWSHAIVLSGRSIVLDTTEGSFTTAIAPPLERYSNQWAAAPDVETNGPDEGHGTSCEKAPYAGCRSVFPLTSYSHWSDRFDYVATWQPYGGPDGFNDYDSIEVGDGGSASGMSIAAEESQLSLWALGSSPLILGSDLSGQISNAYGSSRGLAATDLRLLENRAVVEVDQDAIDAARISDIGSAQVFAKVEPSGDGIVGLFDSSTVRTGSADTISTTTTAMGLPPDEFGYWVEDLWNGTSWWISSAGQIVSHVAPEGVALYRVTPAGPS